MARRDQLSPSALPPGRRWYAPSSLARGLIARPKLLWAIGAALVTLLVARLATPLPSSVRAALAWNAGALVYLALSFRVMARCAIGEIRRRAVEEDESRFVFTAVILLAIASSFTAVIDLIAVAKAAQGWLKPACLTLAGATILTSWAVMQIVFTLHYAHAYYRPAVGGGDARGLLFPKDEAPDYWDFLYFTTSIGATSQTSDVSIAAKSLRRLVTLQSVLAFVFNTMILALAINVASGLIGGG